MKMPLVKPFRVTLKVDAEKKKGEKKKIYYSNVYDEVLCLIDRMRSLQKVFSIGAMLDEYRCMHTCTDE